MIQTLTYDMYKPWNKILDKHLLKPTAKLIIYNYTETQTSSSTYSFIFRIIILLCVLLGENVGELVEKRWHHLRGSTTAKVESSSLWH